MVDFIRNEVILVKYGMKMSMDIQENMLKNVKHKNNKYQDNSSDTRVHKQRFE